MDDMEIRAARLDDVPEIEGLTLAIFPQLATKLQIPHERLLSILIRLRMADSTPTEGVFVGTDDSQVVGMLFVDIQEHRSPSIREQWQIVRPLGMKTGLQLLWTLQGLTYRPSLTEAYFNGIAIKPAFRQQGLAQGLMDIAGAYARDKGKQRACGFIAKTNLISQRVMLRDGWKQVPHRSPLQRILSRKTGLLRFEKDLS